MSFILLPSVTVCFSGRGSTVGGPTGNVVGCTYHHKRRYLTDEVCLKQCGICLLLCRCTIYILRKHCERIPRILTALVTREFLDRSPPFPGHQVGSGHGSVAPRRDSFDKENVLLPWSHPELEGLTSRKQGPSPVCRGCQVGQCTIGHSQVTIAGGRRME